MPRLEWLSGTWPIPSPPLTPNPPSLPPFLLRPGIVDLPSEGGVVSTDAITLPEIFHDFETAVADLG